MRIYTHLNFGGNCREAFEFYQEHLGGKIGMMLTQGEQPGLNSVPPEMRDKITYGRMSLGETEIMGNDVPAERFQPMRSVYLSLAVESTEQAERVYALLTEGGQIFMPMEETFFAHRFAMFRDRFGVSWMLLHPKPMQG